jgi:hypothetical protein
MSVMMKIKLYILIGYIIFFASAAFSAEPSVKILNKWSDLNTDTKECDGFSYDNFILKINNNGKEITHEFCSSREADAEVVQDAIGDYFLILKSTAGHGTNAWTDYFTVYRINPNLIEYLKTPISDGAGPFSRWYYDYKITKPEHGGLVFTFSLRIEGKDAEWYPKEKERIIQIK